MEKLILEGEDLFSQGQVDKAEKRFVRVIEKNPTCKEAYNNLGVIAHNRNELNRAREYFQRALRLDPGYREAINNLANIGREKPGSIEDKPGIRSYGKKITGQNIVIVNPFNNKFNELYSSYFGRNNEVRVIRASNSDEILALEPIMD